MKFLWVRVLAPQDEIFSRILKILFKIVMGIVKFHILKSYFKITAWITENLFADSRRLGLQYPSVALNGTPAPPPETVEI